MTIPFCPVDAGGKIHLIDDLDEYRKTVHKGTWNAVIKLADELREKKIKFAFFSSTPQGGECRGTTPRFPFVPIHQRRLIGCAFCHACLPSSHKRRETTELT